METSKVGLAVGVVWQKNTAEGDWRPRNTCLSSLLPLNKPSSYTTWYFSFLFLKM